VAPKIYIALKPLLSTCFFKTDAALGYLLCSTDVVSAERDSHLVKYKLINQF